MVNCKNEQENHTVALGGREVIVIVWSCFLGRGIWKQMLKINTFNLWSSS